MRILHTSHGGLPDSRVEKTALTMKNEGHELLFLGGGPTRSQAHNAFSETFHIPMVNHIRVVYDPRFKKRWIAEIDRIKPDVVHAHNIIAAAMMLETEYPVIYDDHEYWSKQDFRFTTRGLIRRIAGKAIIRVTPEWERRIFENYPVLTVSEKNASEHRRIAKHVGVTHNFPLMAEVMNLTNPDKRKGAVYVGSDFDNKTFAPHRDMTGIRDILDFDILTGMPHSEMMEALTHYRIGLTPWKPHSLHEYCDTNKTYEYLNAGLQVVITDTLSGNFKNNKYVHPFKTYAEIPELLESLPDISGQEIMEHARKHYVWENNSETIIAIYKYAKAAD